MSRNKQRGTRWESAIVAYLRDNGWRYADRLPLSGARDRGDVTLGNGSPLVIEAKNAARIELAAWVDEANTEADNASEHRAWEAEHIGVVWVHRKGKADPADGYVVMDGATFLHLLRSADY